jgi:ELWxxDGT repeat protein
LDPHDPYRALVYFDQCGWNGYVHAGVHRRVFRFSDSHLTGSFKDAGLPDNAEVIYDDYRTSEFAGILCVSGEAYVCNEELAPCYIRGGREMWISDGTSLGTVRVSDINPGLASSDPAYITNVGGAVLFSAYQSPFGRELWRSDGTRLGTVMVADIFVGIGSSNPTYMLLVNGACSWWLRMCGVYVYDSPWCCAVRVDAGTIFFSASNNVHGRELWRTTGLPTDDLSSAWRRALFTVPCSVCCRMRTC